MLRTYANSDSQGDSSHAHAHTRTHVRAGIILDKSAQLGTKLFDTELPPSEVILRKRANAKFFAYKLSGELAKLDDSPLINSYLRSTGCNQTLIQKGQKLESRYCGTRWCNVCNRIRTARLIEGYQPVLQQIQDKHFVTLTLPNCAVWELDNIIPLMLTTQKQIQERLKKRHQRRQIDYQIVGMRKLECTYNATENTYHPHFHFIVQGAQASGALLEEWLNSVPSANRAAQDIRPAALNSEKELFKYFSKVVSKTGKGKNIVVVRALDNIYQSMFGRRVFQPIGIRKALNVSEEMPDLMAQYFEDWDDTETAKTWDWDGENWRDYQGNSICEYRPSANQRRFINNNYVT
jgi:hypothetical protein